MTTSVKFAQLAREALRDGKGTIRLSGLAREVVHDGIGTIRVAGLCREVLRSYGRITKDAPVALEWRRTFVRDCKSPMDYVHGVAAWAGEPLDWSVGSGISDDSVIYLIW